MKAKSACTGPPLLVGKAPETRNYTHEYDDDDDDFHCMMIDADDHVVMSTIAIGMF